jgi:hypothetical protein
MRHHTGDQQAAKHLVGFSAQRSRRAGAGRGPKHGRGGDHYFLIGEPGENAQWLLDRRIGDAETSTRHRKIGGRGA